MPTAHPQLGGVLLEPRRDHRFSLGETWGWAQEGTGVPKRGHVLAGQGCDTLGKVPGPKSWWKSGGNSKDGAWQCCVRLPGRGGSGRKGDGSPRSLEDSGTTRHGGWQHPQHRGVLGAHTEPWPPPPQKLLAEADAREASWDQFRDGEETGAGSPARLASGELYRARPSPGQGAGGKEQRWRAAGCGAGGSWRLCGALLKQT